MTTIPEDFPDIPNFEKRAELVAEWIAEDLDLLKDENSDVL